MIKIISGWEWILLAVIFLAIFLWGPQKLPELARALGEAKKEFDSSSKQVNKFASSTRRIEPSSDDIYIQTAKKIGINTEGKTKEQISQEIIEKAKDTNDEENISS